MSVFPELNLFGVEESPSNELDFQPIEEFQEQQKQEISRTRSILGAPVKGFIKQVVSTFGVESPQKALTRLKKGLPTREEEVAQELEKILPTEERFAERALERAGKFAIPLPGAGALKTLGRAGLAALGGQLAQEAGAGPISQAVAEIAALGAPALGKRIIPRANQRALVDFARRMGLKEADIGRSIQSEGKIKLFSKFARKTPDVQKRLAKTKDALGNVFDSIKESDAAQEFVDPTISGPMIGKLSSAMRKFPSRVRSTFAADFEDFLNAPTTGDEIINLWQDINSSFTGSRKQLVAVKNILRQGLREVNPELAKDFESANKLFAGFKTLERSLKPSLFSTILDIGEVGELFAGITTGSFGLIKSAIGSAAARSLSSEMLVNPRLQSLSKKTLQALNQNKFRAAASLKKLMAKEVAKTDKEAASLLMELDLTDLQNKTKE
ncbi:MAG: hypothetical protein ACE5GV_00415 [Candidatus Scalindua sp.]